MTARNLGDVLEEPRVAQMVSYIHAPLVAAEISLVLR